MKKLILIGVFILAIAILAEPAAAGISLTTETWPKFHRDLNASGYTDATPPTKNYTLWTKDLQYKTAPPIIFNNTIYLGSRYSLYAINLTDGSTIWSKIIGSAPTLFSYQTPAVDSDGIIYMDSTDQKIYAFYPNGTQKWNGASGYAKTPYGPLTIDDNYVYASECCNPSLITILNITDGSLKQNWLAPILTSIQAGITVQGNNVYFSGFDNVSELYVPTNTTDWTTYMGDESATVIAIEGTRLFIGTGPTVKNITALSTATGAILWNFETSGHTKSSPAVHSGVVFAGSDDTNYYAINASTGIMKWNYSASTAVARASPAIAGDRVFVTRYDGSNWMLDALYESTGTVDWSYQLSGSPNCNSQDTSAPAIVDGIIILNCGNYLYAIGGYMYSSISGVDFMLEEDYADATTTAKVGTQNVLMNDTSTGLIVGRFVTDYDAATDDIGLSGIAVDSDGTTGKAVMYRSSYPSPITRKDLYIPKVGTNTSVHICPNAQTLAQVTDTCAGGFTLSVGETKQGVTLSSTTIAGQAYFLASNVTGTGGGNGPYQTIIPEFSPFTFVLAALLAAIGMIFVRFRNRKIIS